MKNFVLFLLTLGTSSFAMNCIEATMLRAMPMPLMSEYVLDSVYDREILDDKAGNTEIIKIHYSGNEQTSLTFYGTDGSVLQEANYRVSVSGTGPEFKVERRFTVPYNTRTFYLYNAGYQLASKTVTSSCATGRTWKASQGKCERNYYTVSTSAGTG